MKGQIHDRIWTVSVMGRSLKLLKYAEKYVKRVEFGNIKKTDGQC